MQNALAESLHLCADMVHKSGRGGGGILEGCENPVMGFLGKASEFFAAPGAAVGSFVGDALHNAANYACQLHYNTPGVIFDVSPFNRELWKELCKERPSGLPPSPRPPFLGGQCQRVVYLMYFVYKVSFSFGDRYVEHYFYVWGAISSVKFASEPDPNVPGEYRVGLEVFCHGETHPNNPIPYGESQRVFKWIARYDFDHTSPRITEENFTLKRADNQPDSCGDPSIVVAPVILPIEQRTTNISIVSVDQTTVNNVTAVLDFPSASVDFNLSVPLRVAIDNRKFYLNIDGWHSGEPSSDSPPDLTPVQDNILQLQGTLNQYFAPVNPSVDNTLMLVSPSGGKPSDEQKNVPGAAWLIIDLTKTPDKAQYGGDSPTVYFAGWIEFLKEGRAFPRQQINFERSIFRFPDGADGYAYTFTNGAQGNVSVYVEEAQ